MPALLTACGFAYHVRTLMDARVVLSPSFPCFSLLIFEQKRDCLQFTYELTSTRVWQATLESEELREKGRSRSNAGLNRLRKQPSFFAPGPATAQLNERTTSRDIALCSANRLAMLHLGIDNLNYVGEQIKSLTAHDVLLVQIERNFNFKERVINLTRSPCYTVQSC